MLTLGIASPVGTVYQDHNLNRTARIIKKRLAMSALNTLINVKPSVRPEIVLNNVLVIQQHYVTTLLNSFLCTQRIFRPAFMVMCTITKNDTFPYV